MRKKKAIGLLLGFFILISPGFAQKYNLEGKVFDRKTGKALEGANILLKPGGMGTATDHNGYFHLKKVPAGSYTLTVSYLGYITKELKVQLNRPLNLPEIFLEPGPILMSPTEIQVSSSVPVTHGKITILQSQIEQEATRDIGDYLRAVPNVSGVRKGAVGIDPVVRGFKFSQLNVHMDGGVRIEGGCPNRMDPTSAHVEMEDIENIEIIKGPYVLRYGPTLGGVINLVTKKPVPGESSEFKIHLRALKGYESNWDGDKEHIQLYGGNNRLYFTVSGSQLRYGNYEDGNGNTIPSSFNKWNYSADLAFRPADNHEFIISMNDFHGRHVKFPALPMDERKDDTRVLSFNYSARALTKSISDLKFKIYRSEVYHEMDNKEKPFGDTVAAVSIIDPVNIGGRIETGIKAGENGQLFAGADYEHIYKDGSRTKNMYEMPPMMDKMPVKVEKLWSEATIQNLGVFVEYNGRSGVLDYIASIRFDHNQANAADMNVYKSVMGGKDTIQMPIDDASSSFNNLSASLGFNYSINENTKIGLGLGRGVRSPDMLERFIRLLPVGFDKYDYLGNPQLKPETNYQADIYLEWSDEKWGKLSLDGFYSLVQNYIGSKQLPASEILPNSAGVIGVKQFINLEKPVTFSGFEFTYGSAKQYDLQFQMNASYTLGTFKSIYYKLDVIEDDPVNEIPPFEANAMVRYIMFNRKFIPSLHFRYVASQNRVSQAFEEKATPSFALLHFYFSYQFNSSLKITGGVKNIFDKAYYEHLNRRVLGSGMDLYEPGRRFFVQFIFNL